MDAVILLFFFSVVLSHFELDEADRYLVLFNSTRVTWSWTKLTVILWSLEEFAEILPESFPAN